MASLLYFSAFTRLVFFLIITISFGKPLCKDYERSALLEFGRNFVIKRSASADPWAYPKVSSWKIDDNNNNCCLWDGVECDGITGHVIVLDLSSSCLFGSINQSSSLFNLVHLQILHLADNDMNFSQIPSKLGRLSSLTYLNLSMSSFYGQVPIEITELSNLTSLDLGANTYDPMDTGYRYFPANTGYLQLESWSLTRLVQNLPHLEKLDLSFVNISSTLPDIFANSTSLLFLNLQNCDFHGLVPSSLGKLTKIRYLNLAYNYFSGQIPSLSNHIHLEFLDLSFNNFKPGELSWLSEQTKLRELRLVGINLVGEIPVSLRNLTSLHVLLLFQNQLTGQIPSWLSNRTDLTVLYLGRNKLHGPIPEAIFQLVNLKELDLFLNHFSDTLRFEMFTSLKHLKRLHLSVNNIALPTNFSTNATLPKFEILNLIDCNLRELPEFIRYQDKLYALFLGLNQIGGHIPRWMGNTSTETLVFLSLGYNLITSFEHSSILSSLNNLAGLELAHNKLQGSVFPTLPPSILYCNVSNNFLTGEVLASFCNLSSLLCLDVSNNYLSGIIPQCMFNMTDTLVSLNFANNFFRGHIPDDAFSNRSNSLRAIDLSGNNLEGQIPRSLAMCRMLEILDLSENHIHDNFPFWLGHLQNFRILILRSNNLFGALNSSATGIGFRNLQILDLSHNEFMGTLPFDFFLNFERMKAFDVSQLAYILGNITLKLQSGPASAYYYFHIVLENKGTKMKYLKIPNSMVSIDFSNNRFHGDIPSSIGTLKMLNMLNLSNNHLSNHIPSALQNLKNLESLDLSGNRLSGEIPSELTQLTFLSYFNVSRNELAGPIPQGKQFATFENTSYQDNFKLCGSPLTTKCENLDGSPLPSPSLVTDAGCNLPICVDWKVVLIGYGSGLLVGVVLGLKFSTRHQTWLLKTFRIRQMQVKRRTNTRNNH